MDVTVYAAWLNDVFGLFDTFFLSLHHELAVSYGDTLTPIANALGAAGHYGILFIALGLILLIFRKTRMAGAAILLAIAIAGGLSEFVIKDIVARPRPFEMSEAFNAWWQFVGSPGAHSSSFPSGHVAAATAAAIALAYAARRWWVSLAGVLMVVLMAIDRMYLQVHYPSDVLGGFFVGFFGGIIGYAIIQGVWRLFGEHPDQIAERKAAASRHAAPITIPRGGEVQYEAVNMQPQAAAPQPAPRPTTPTGPAPASARFAEHAVPQTLQTAGGNTVVVPGVPVAKASPDTTQLLDCVDANESTPRATADSGFQMAEEYYRE